MATPYKDRCGEIQSTVLGDRITNVLCNSIQETRNHLYFECSFSSRIWEQLVKGILCNSYTHKWDEVIELISASSMEKRKRFCLRYAFQISVYMLWRKRNKRRHGDSPLPHEVLTKAHRQSNQKQTQPGPNEGS